MSLPDLFHLFSVFSVTTISVSYLLLHYVSLPDLFQSISVLSVTTWFASNACLPDMQPNVMIWFTVSASPVLLPTQCPVCLHHCVISWYSQPVARPASLMTSPHSRPRSNYPICVLFHPVTWSVTSRNNTRSHSLLVSLLTVLNIPTDAFTLKILSCCSNVMEPSLSHTYTLRRVSLFFFFFVFLKSCWNIVSASRLHTLMSMHILTSRPVPAGAPVCIWVCVCFFFFCRVCVFSPERLVEK